VTVTGAPDHEHAFDSDQKHLQHHRDLEDGANGAAVGVEADPITNLDTAVALNSTFSDSEVEGFLNAHAETINEILDALRDAGIVEP
jgi:hypothetical protein